MASPMAHQQLRPKSFLETLMENNVKKLLKGKPLSVAEPWLVLDEVLSLSTKADDQQSSTTSGKVMHFDMTHLGSLFVTNRARDGRFSMQELRNFARLVSEFHDKYPLQEVQMRLRAHCTMELWSEASRSPEAFADWFCRLAVENSKEAVRKEMVAEGLLEPGTWGDGSETEREALRQVSGRRKLSAAATSSANASRPSTVNNSGVHAPRPSMAAGGAPLGERSGREIRRETKRLSTAPGLGGGGGNKPPHAATAADPVGLDEEGRLTSGGGSNKQSLSQSQRKVQQEKEGHEKVDHKGGGGHSEEDDDDDDDDDDEDDEDDEDDDLGAQAELQGLNLLRDKPEDFVGSATIMTLHKMFQVQAAHDMTFQSFLDMMQQRGEDCNLMVLDDEAYDEVVPLPVIREFAENFLTGIVDLMTELHIKGPERDRTNSLGSTSRMMSSRKL